MYNIIYIGDSAFSSRRMRDYCITNGICLICMLSVDSHLFLLLISGLGFTGSANTKWNDIWGCVSYNLPERSFRVMARPLSGGRATLALCFRDFNDGNKEKYYHNWTTGFTAEDIPVLPLSLGVLGDMSPGSKDLLMQISITDLELLATKLGYRIGIQFDIVSGCFH